MKLLNRSARWGGRKVSSIRTRTSSRLLVLSCGMAVVAMVGGFAAGLILTTPYASAQSDGKRIGLAATVNPQIRIARPKVEQKSYNFNERFEGHSDWLKKISFDLENISSKPVIYLELNLLFPETEKTGSMMMYPLRFGHRPGSKIRKGEPLRLMPKQMLEISLVDESDKVLDFIKLRQSPSSINEVELEIGFILFADGTGWAAGTFFRVDPNNPNRYLKLEESNGRIVSP
jgi:hypothetical protein